MNINITWTGVMIPLPPKRSKTPPKARVGWDMKALPKKVQLDENENIKAFVHEENMSAAKEKGLLIEAMIADSAEEAVDMGKQKWGEGGEYRVVYECELDDYLRDQLHEGSYSAYFISVEPAGV
jgi:hypothetical protein